MGMTDEQFWRSTPAQFTLRVEAYKRDNRPSAMYFREMFCLLYNINRSEKAPALEPTELMLLHGEKPPRKARREKSLMDDPAAMADFQQRLNQASRREKNEADLFGLDTWAYLDKRARGQITLKMVEEALRKKYFELNPDAPENSFEMPIISNPRLLGESDTPLPAPVPAQPSASMLVGIEMPAAVPVQPPVPIQPPIPTQHQPILINPNEWD